MGAHTCCLLLSPLLAASSVPMEVPFVHRGQGSTRTWLRPWVETGLSVKGRTCFSSSVES
ncbi:hypothetical protein I79_018599 [Cricetulus griseus]|uniref:Uncharacterized protein n=1 Tax=Cricetulus griseus TaxID=10029 RepID=G3I555_CRIGR|nr:hypothetical protein I79_018599 [Cricetulus griseus]